MGTVAGGLVHAVDARSGKLRWTYDPKAWKHSPRGIAIGFNTNRGIAHWQGRLFVGTGDGRLVALNREDGSVLWATRAFPVGERKSINGAPREVPDNLNATGLLRSLGLADRRLALEQPVVGKRVRDDPRVERVVVVEGRCGHGVGPQRGRPSWCARWCR